MIQITIGDTGTISISQETVDERLRIAAHHEQQKGLDQNQVDELSQIQFKAGWESAVAESQMWYVKGKIEEFYQTMGGQDPHANEPEGTGETLLDQQDDFHNSLTDEAEIVDEAVAQHVQDETGVRVVVADGPEEHPYDTAPNAGQWVMSDDELQARLKSEYERGSNDRLDAWLKNRTVEITRRTLRGKALELVAEDTMKTFAKGEGTPTPFHKIFGDNVDAFIESFARSLGFKVVD